MKLKGLLILLTFLAFNCTREDKTNIPLSAYVASDAIAAVQINNLSALRDSLGTNEFISRLENLGPYNSIYDKVAFLEQLDQESQGMLVFSKSAQDSVDFFFVSESLADMFSIDSLRTKYAEKIKYRSRSLHKYTVNEKTVYSTLSDDMLFISSSARLLDDTLEKIEDIKPDTSFQRLYTIADKNQPLNIFLNLGQNDSLVAQIASKEAKISVSDFADWIYYDLEIKSDLLALNGVAITNDSVPKYLSLFKKTGPLPNALPFFAPVQSEAILSYTFENRSVFEKNRQQYLKKSTESDSIFNAVEEIGNIYLQGEKAILLKTYGSEILLEFLGTMQKNVVDYQGNSIRELDETNFLNMAFEPIIQDFSANFCAVLENVFVFAPTMETVQKVISNYKKGSTFDKSPVYVSASKNLGTSANVLFISNAGHIEQLMQDELIENIFKTLKDPKLEGYAFGAQVVADGDFYHINLSTQKLTKKMAVKMIRPILDVALDTTLTNDPQFVTNHNNKRKEIVVQDVTNKLYLISPSGKILWKKQLNGRIQGKIHQVDLYKNGRLQLAFNTNNQFLIVDRNGKEIKPFTFSYEGGNLNSLAVFDYEGKRDYRFVVTQGEKVFMYNRKGEIVTGFKYTRAEKPIINAPKHIVIGNKDHLVFQLEGGILKILNRVGDVRVKVNDKIDFSQNEVFLYKNKFTVSDKKGVLHQIGTSGKISRTNFNLNQDHGLDATSNTLVFMNDNELNIRGKNIELDLGVYTQPKIFYLNDKIYVGVTDIQNQKVYLFDSQGKPIANFPIFGTSIIDLDIDNDNRLVLTVKNLDNSILVYAVH